MPDLQKNNFYCIKSEATGATLNGPMQYEFISVHPSIGRQIDPILAEMDARLQKVAEQEKNSNYTWHPGYDHTIQMGRMENQVDSLSAQSQDNYQTVHITLTSNRPIALGGSTIGPYHGYANSQMEAIKKQAKTVKQTVVPPRKAINVPHQQAQKRQKPPVHPPAKKNQGPAPPILQVRPNN
jgi:hypothetical protein